MTSHFEPATFGDISILSGFHILADYESRPRKGVAGAMGQAMLPRRPTREQRNYVIFPYGAETLWGPLPSSSRAIQNPFLDERTRHPLGNASPRARRHKLLQLPEWDYDHPLHHHPDNHLRVRVRGPPSPKDLTHITFPKSVPLWTSRSTRGFLRPSSTTGSGRRGLVPSPPPESHR
jgi:hypothetical protein